ncbi:hypothetical protein HanIR_Chr14g0691721 [Helianthus annuus]|nr:hypothetical protein HanIR_Chr14g0691721 [Helianthus annuus]
MKIAYRNNEEKRLQQFARERKGTMKRKYTTIHQIKHPFDPLRKQYIHAEVANEIDKNK